MASGAALSEHPVTAHATGEVAGTVLEAVGDRPDLAVVFVTPPHAGALEDVAGAVTDILHPLALIGCAAETVVGPGREVERTAGVSLLAADTGPLVAVRLRTSERDLDVDDGPSEVEVEGWPEHLPFEPRALVLLADPFSFDAEGFLAWLARRHPGLPVVGGLASGARGPGGSRLAIGRSVHTDGAVGVVLGPGIAVDHVVSQGCRPFGQPFVVTRAEGSIIYELAGKPALERLVAQAHASLSADEVAVIEQGGLHIGRVIDEHRDTFGRGDFLVRNVHGADRRNGAMAVGDVVPVGTTVQFHLLDARSADEELRALLAGRSAESALLFTCTGRGTRLFAAPDHDAAVLAERLGPIPVVGCSSAGELGPVGGRNFVHGFTASMVLLRPSSAGLPDGAPGPGR